MELEEASLTKQRSSMNADEFRVLAANFDEKVQLISNQQQAKNQRRMEQRRKDQMTLMAATGPVFETLMRDTGADVIIEQRYAFIWNDAINLTDVAIESIDAFLGYCKTSSGAGKE